MKGIVLAAIVSIFVLSMVSSGYASNILATVTIVGEGLQATIIVPQNTIYNSKNVPLTFTVSGPTTWIKYSLDNKKNVTITGNITMKNLNDGQHNVIIFAKDASNEAKSNKAYFTVDTRPPTVRINSPDNGHTYIKTPVTLTFKISEPASWIGYSLDNAKNVTITGNTNIDGLGKGAHNIVLYANDSAGNMGSDKARFFYYYCQGDVNGDEKINMADINLMFNRIGQNCKDKKYEAKYDLNDDCRINLIDAWIVLSNYGYMCR